MDRAKELLEAVDPVRPSNAPRLDPEAELRKALAAGAAMETTGNGDFVAPGRPGLLLRPRLWAAVAAALIVIIAAVGALLVQTINPGPPQPADTATPSVPAANADPNTWRGVTLIADVGNSWHRIRFDLPPGWSSIGDYVNGDYPSQGAVVFDEGGSDENPEYVIYAGPISGKFEQSQCQGFQEQYVELDSQPVDLPVNSILAGPDGARFVYRVIQGPTLRASMGITTRAAGTEIGPCEQFYQVPVLPSGNYLFFSNRIRWNGSWPGWQTAATGSQSPEFTSVDEARSFMTTPLYAKFKRMFTSLSIEPGEGSVDFSPPNPRTGFLP